MDTWPQMLEQLVPWLHAVMVTHMSYLATVPDLMSLLSVLRHLLDMRVNLFDKLCKLHGKLDLILTQVIEELSARVYCVISLWCKIICSNVFMQGGNQDLVQHSMQPDAEITMGMDVDEGI